jgi:heme exporter protein B
MLMEWRRKYALGGVLLYLGSSIFIVHIVFNMRGGVITVFSWNALFWIIMLFAAVNAIAKSFIQENPGRQLYFYTITSAQGLIVSKILYNSLMMVLLMLLGIVVYILFMGNPVRDMVLFSGTLLAGGLAFASVFTLISGIAARTSSSSILMAILGFPVVIPVLLLLIRLSGKAIEGTAGAGFLRDWIGLGAIIVIAATTSILLFPYLWRSN